MGGSDWSFRGVAWERDEDIGQSIEFSKREVEVGEILYALI